MPTTFQSKAERAFSYDPLLKRGRTTFYDDLPPIRKSPVKILRAIACLFGYHQAEETLRHDAGETLTRCRCGHTTFTDVA